MFDFGRVSPFEEEWAKNQNSRRVYRGGKIDEYVPWLCLLQLQCALADEMFLVISVSVVVVIVQGARPRVEMLSILKRTDSSLQRDHRVLP